MPRKSFCIKVTKPQGQKTVILITKLELADKSLSFQKDGEYLCIPLIRAPKQHELEIIQAKIKNISLETAIFLEKRLPIQTLTQALQNEIPQELLAGMPQAFDIIGDIVVVDVPPQLKPYQNVIGDALLKTQKNAKTVLAKAGDIGGVYRLREYAFIAGENKTQTIHKEFGCQYHIDVAKAYFSPRLSHEHERVAGQIQAKEVVVDMFAGVGPFSVLIAKRNDEVKVYAVDINPDAFELLEENVRANKVENQVFPILSDVRTVAATTLVGVADRVIMNLPETAIDFVDAACKIIKPEGGLVHFYGFIRSPDSIEDLQQRFTRTVVESGRRVQVFLFAKKIRETAPFESQVVLDAKIS